jgi:multidrug efflux pump subunit AcrA (membrane-fusion protein)
MFRKGYNSKLDLEAQKDAVAHAQLELDVKTTDLEALEKFTKAKELETLKGLLNIAEARLAAETASLELEEARLKRAEDQLKNCIIVAEKSGMVLHPSAAEWKEQPDIEEGASVREDQVLLMMPDLSQMQVQVGIHESKVDRLRLGMPCRIQLQDGYVDGEISEIASITKGGGWWNGNMVNYDTVVKVDDSASLKPGMTVSVEVFLAKHKDVVIAPVATVLELDEKFYCWVDTGEPKPEKREVIVGDSNDTFLTIVEGVSEGENVVLNPRDFVEEASAAALKSIESKAAPEDVPEFNAKNAEGRKKPDAKKAAPKLTGAAIMKMADKNKDGALTKDELDEKSKKDFEKNDTNGDGKLDVKEVDAALKKAIAGGGKKK